jgi:Family of unknown function (DUF6055)
VLKAVVVFLLVLVLGAVGVLAQADPEEITFRDRLDDDQEEIEYEVELEAGQSVLLLAEATSGDLDPFVMLSNPDGEMLLLNDDRSPFDLDSALGHTASQSGMFTVTVGRSVYRFGETSGNFRLTMLVGDEQVFEDLDELTRYELTGDTETLTTEHFAVHYTDRGADESDEDYAFIVATAFEEVWQIQVVELRWPAPPSDSLSGGDGLYDVYIGDLINDFRNALGFTSPRVVVGDNISSPVLETRAATSIIVVENDFEEVLDVDPSSDQLALLRSTIAHEFHHAIQVGYDYRDMHRWYYEATAVYMETTTLIKEQDATDFIGYNFAYPELCFGTEVTDPGVGLLIYGDWLFIQSLVDAHGEEIVQKMWQNIAQYEGFASLEETLARYNDDVPTALARYRIQNLVRDYELAGAFEATVWLEDVIDDTGRWSFNGEGIQELSANYFELDVQHGVYEVELTRESTDLELWAITIDGEEATAIPLGTGGNVEVDRQDYTYIMVFNPAYDDDINDCTYEEYFITVNRVNDETVTTDGSVLWDASNFEPLSFRR